MKNITFKTVLLLLACVSYNLVIAQTAAPHTSRGESKLANVSLSWKSPTAEKTMQWHTGEDYDGISGMSLNGEVPTLYLANRFDKDDLKEYDGNTIDSISYFHYRPVLEVTLLLYENDKVVREQKVDIKDFPLDKMRTVKLDQSYQIHADVDLTVAVKFVHGTNLDFVGIMDRGPGIVGKGDLYSYDGKNWKNVVRGNFLVTAHLAIPEAGEPSGYNIYRGDIKINTDLVDTTSVFMKGEPKGTYDYYVTAVYENQEEKSNVVSLTNIPVTDTRPVATDVQGTVDGLDVTVNWKKPILADNILTWGNGEAGKALGGTSGSVRKIWAVNSFESDELLSYGDHRITALNIMLNTAVKEMRLVFLEDGVIVYSEEISGDVLAGLELNKWVKFPLAQPFTIDPSKNLKFGYYVVHEKDLYPGRVDKGPAMRNGCYIATSTAKDDFNKTNPTWSAIEKSVNANWMLSADVEAMSEIPVPVVKDYDVYREGIKVKSGLKETTYTEQAEPGDFAYTIVANYVDGVCSPASSAANVTVKLPAEYLRPTFSEKTFDKGKLSLKWDVFSELPSELKHYGEPKSYWELTNEGEDVEVYIGAEFSEEELALYSDYEVTSVNVMLFNEAKTLEVMLCSDKKVLVSKKVTDIKSNEMMTVTLDEPVAIPAGKSLIVGYHIIYADGKYPITLDAGPNVSGGAMISFDGTGWYSIAKVDKTFDYNVVVGANVRLKGAEPEAIKGIESIEKVKAGRNAVYPSAAGTIYRTLNEMKEMTAFGVNEEKSNSLSVCGNAENKPEVKNFRLYCNGSLIEESAAKEYTATLPYGTYSYAVSAVYSNGWESALCEPYEFEYQQPNLQSGPYGLSGTLEGKNLSLLWQSPESASELNYQDKNSGSKAVGLTRSSGVEGYFLISYPAEDLTDKVGEYITHIKFGLYDINLQSAAVVVYYDRNLVYEQDVDVSTLISGENSVRLDKPMEIPAGREVCVGYYVQHEDKVKPNLTDEGPAVDGKGNLICTGTSWKTLKSMNKDLDYNWRISAVLQKAGIALKQIASADKKEEPVITYTVYRNDIMLVEGITVPNYIVEDALDAVYTVTARIDGIETAPSNAVVLGDPTGIMGTENVRQGYYDTRLQQVIFMQNAALSLYNTSGKLLYKAYTDKLDISAFPVGVYIIKVQFAGEEEHILKVVK